MFAYISKINHKDIVCLYYDVDDDDSSGSEYLFNTQTIAEWAKWAKWAKGDEIEVREDIPRFFAYS